LSGDTPDLSLKTGLWEGREMGKDGEAGIGKERGKQKRNRGE